MTSKLHGEYADFMKAETGRDEYQCELVVLEDNFMSDEKDQGCGGIILYTANSRIVCENTLHQRLDLAYEELLPSIRNTLFPAK
jgi:vacuolar-type H+-ATPase subunit E/Vma4